MEEKQFHLKIIKHAKLTMLISAILLLISIVSLCINGLNFGIDFIGGSLVQIDLKAPFDNDEVAQLFSAFDAQAQIVKEGDDETQVAITTKLDLTQQQREAIIQAFSEKYNVTESDFSFDQVSASIGAELKQQAIIASLIAIFCMLVYISFRFEFWFGVSAIIALVHDLLIVLGFYAIFQIPVNSSFIAAMLTILGYSINDTIVIFDRIRAQQRRYASNEREALIDESVNATLSRTINTSATTLLAIGCVYIFGVSAIREFALPMIIGFIAGSYSSIFIASPCWYFLKNKFAKRTRMARVRR